MTLRLLSPRQFNRHPTAAGALPPPGVMKSARKLAAEQPDYANWCFPRPIFLENENLIVGNCGGKGVNEADRTVEIGYGIAPGWRGRGVATEAVRLLTEEALASNLLPFATVAHTNEASKRVLYKNGYRHRRTIDLLGKPLEFWHYPSAVV